MSLYASNVAVSICSALLLVLAAFRTGSNRKLSDFWLVMAISQLPVALITYVLIAVATARRVRYDLYLNAADRLFFFPANHLARFLGQHPTLHSICAADYLYWWVPIWIALLATAHRNLGEAWRALATYLLSGILAIPIYLLFPACGPATILPNFPEIYRGPIHVVFAIGAPAHLAPTNCVPSVHFTVALLALWFLRKSKPLLILALVNVVITVVGTLGLGEHYLIDLLLAIPYTWFVIKVPEWITRWRQDRERIAHADQSPVDTAPLIT
jgi:hypothetical protein